MIHTDNNRSKKGCLYLIPNLIADTGTGTVMPPYNHEVILNIKYFLVENPKPARRFLKKCGIPTPFKGITFHTVNKHTPPGDKQMMLSPLEKGTDVGFLSDAGYPAIADPGKDLAWLAHQNGFLVKPLVGPSSILLALSGSGLNGQQFTFHGYLPVKKKERIQRIRDLEKNARKNGYTQVFMETPYRNRYLLEDIIASCSTKTRLCVACDLTSPEEEIHTYPIAVWKKIRLNLHKRQAIFLINTQ